MSVFDVPIGGVVPADAVVSERDRLVIPVQGGVRDFSADGIPVYYDPYIRSVCVVPNITFIVFERTDGGWVRVE